METNSDRHRTLFGRNPTTSHDGRHRSSAADVQPFSPTGGPFRLARSAGSGFVAAAQPTTRPIEERPRPAAAEGFDFNSLTDAALLQWLTARGHRPNVLVECTRGSADTVVRHLMTWCALPFRYSAIPGTLELPLIRRGTLLLNDVAALTLSQQVMLYDWLSHESGAMQVVSVASAPIEVLVEDGQFLEGLFYRLNVLRLNAGRGTRPAPLSAWRDSRETVA